MNRPALAGLLAAFAILLAACGGSADTVSLAAKRQGFTPSTTTTTAPPGAITPDAALNPNLGGAGLTACMAEKAMLLTALEALKAMNGAYPTPAGTNGWGPLVGTQLAEASNKYAYTLVDGKPVLDPLGGCV